MEIGRLEVGELAARLAGAGPRDDVRLLDVRTPEELAIARIDGFRRLDEAEVRALRGLDRETELVFLCHHGMRSEAAARHFVGLGFRNVWNVEGGIDAWSREVDPKVPRY